MTAKLVQLPSNDLTDVPQKLRDLADAIEAGGYGDAHQCAWVVDCGAGRIEVGLAGKSASAGAEAYYLLGLGMRRMEQV